jgi:hypothetical protein
MLIRSDARRVPGKPSATNTKDQPLIWLVFFYRKLAASAERLELYRIWDCEWQDQYSANPARHYPCIK